MTVEPEASVMFTNFLLFTKFTQSLLNAMTILLTLSALEIVFNYSISPSAKLFCISHIPYVNVMEASRHYYTNTLSELLILAFVSRFKNSSQISTLHYRWYHAWTVKAYTVISVF